MAILPEEISALDNSICKKFLVSLTSRELAKLKALADLYELDGSPCIGRLIDEAYLFHFPSKHVVESIDEYLR